jgi:hypothetical protein
MTHGARTRGGQLEILWPSFCLTGVLSGFRTFLVLRWTSPEMILGEVASRCGFTWCLSLPTWGVDVDGLACPLHRPTIRSYQTMG